MVNVTNHLKKHNLTVAEIFECDNTCVLENGRTAFCLWMDIKLFRKLEEEDYILCFTVDDDGETRLEYIRTDTPATPCDVAIEVD